MGDYERIKKVILYIQNHSVEQPRLKKLAQVAGLSEFYFNRLFLRWAGITPKQFLKHLTAQHAKYLLNQSRDLLSTALDAGLSGPGRLHDLIVSVEAVTPGQYKSKGLGLKIEYGLHPSPFGLCFIAITPQGICSMVFTDSKDLKKHARDLKKKWPNAKTTLNQKKTKNVVKKIFSRSKKQKISLTLSGTPFQLKVWEALLKIPEGKILSYQDIAKLIGKPNASRAVGTAVGSNAIAYLIPCHRVIRETGIIGEYAWGSERKRAILAWESSLRAV